MKKFFITLLFIIICICYNIPAQAVDNFHSSDSFIYNRAAALAKPAKPSELKNDKPLMYPNPKNGYRTGFARPKTRFAHPNKRFSQPQTRFAHKRPEYIYTKEYQNNIVNRHSPGMKRNNAKQVKPTLAINPKSINTVKVNTNKNKIIACGGITYYGVQNSCK